MWLSAAFGHEQHSPRIQLVEGPCLACKHSRSGNRKWPGGQGCASQQQSMQGNTLALTPGVEGFNSESSLQDILPAFHHLLKHLLRLLLPSADTDKT